MMIDNLAVDASGQLWVAGKVFPTKIAVLLSDFEPKGLPLALASFKHMKNPSSPSPSTAFRLSINTGPNSFYGEKYQFQKVATLLCGRGIVNVDRIMQVFEDDGSLMSGITSVVYNSKR